MVFVRIIDENGLFIEDAFVDELKENTIETPCPDGFYKPKWNGEKWIEGLQQAEIDSIKAVSVMPSLEERLSALEAMELERLMEGVLDG